MYRVHHLLFFSQLVPDNATDAVLTHVWSNKHPLR
jgi:hypothetical protein